MATGVPADRRVFASPRLTGRPDGAAVGVDGLVCGNDAGLVHRP